MHGGRDWVGARGCARCVSRGRLSLGVTWFLSALGLVVGWDGSGRAGFRWMISRGGRMSTRRGA